MKPRQKKCAIGAVLSLSLAVLATADATAQTSSSPAPPGPSARPFAAALGFVPLATRVGPLGADPARVLYPSDRFAIAQLVGGGYVVNPRFRFGAIGIFSEAFTGLPERAGTWQFGGVAPVAIGTFHPVIVGGGPIFGYRSGGRRQANVGAVALVGVSIPVRQGLSVNLAAPVTAVFSHRTTAAVGIAVGLAKVF